jgi:hypothetical protein
MSTTKKRTDPHRPGAIIPAEYRELFCYANPSTVDGWPIPSFNLHMLHAQRTGKPFRDLAVRNPDGTYSAGPEAQPITDDAGKPYPMAAIHKGGACDSCGAWFIEGSVFLHEPTGECIAIGHICAQKMELDFDESAAALMSGKRKAARKAVIERRKRRFRLRLFVEKASRELRAALHRDHHIVQDIRARLIQWGEISEKQEALVLKIDREERERAERPPEKHVPAPIEDGRQTVEGFVVSAKWQDNIYGGALKMTVKVETDEGSWLCWGTAPGSIADEMADLGGLRGCTVRFDAKLKQGRDEHFALFSRPTKATVLSAGDEEHIKRLDNLVSQLTLDGAEPEDKAEGEWADRQRAKIARLRELIK